MVLRGRIFVLLLVFVRVGVIFVALVILPAMHVVSVLRVFFIDVVVLTSASIFHVVLVVIQIFVIIILVTIHRSAFPGIVHFVFLLLIILHQLVVVVSQLLVLMTHHVLARDRDSGGARGSHLTPSVASVSADHFLAGRNASRSTLQIAHLYLLPVEVYMLQFHVLVHAALGAVGFVAALDGALVVPLDLRGRSPVPLPLVVAILTAKLIIRNLVVHGWHDMLHRYADPIVDHLGQTVGMHALSNEIDLVHVLLAKRLDRLPA